MINREQTISNTNLNTPFGVLTDTEILQMSVVQGKRVLQSFLLPSDVNEPGKLVEHLWQLGLTTVWVMPATTLSRTITSSWFESLHGRWVVIVHSNPREPSRPSSTLLWPKGGGRQQERRLTLALPEHAGWNWALADARSLLATVTYLSQVLARPVIDAPDLVAHQLLTELTSDQPGAWLHSSTADLHALATQTGSPITIMERARDLVWMRPLTLAEQRQKYLHKYTHLSWELEACMGVQLGIEAPQYSANGRAYDGQHPGIWRINAERAGSVFDGKRLPSCLDAEWMSTPQVKCCRDIGYQVEVREGYFWPQSHTLIKRWSTRLWQAGERLQTQPQTYRHAQARANAAHTITQLAQSSVTILVQGEDKQGWARPDWGEQIIGRTRAMLFAHLVSLVRKVTMPVLIDSDALWVVSNDPNPLTAAPELVAARRWKGYSTGYEAPLPLSREIKEIFRTVEHAGQAVMALNTLAGEIFS